VNKLPSKDEELSTLKEPNMGMSRAQQPACQTTWERKRLSVNAYHPATYRGSGLLELFDADVDEVQQCCLTVRHQWSQLKMHFHNIHLQQDQMKYVY
jgi:hypothetical protein